MSRADQEEHELLTAIWERAVRATHGFLAEADIQFYRSLVREHALSAVELWVTRGEDGTPVGFMGLADMRIEMLFVDPDYHGRGIGSALIRHAESIKGLPLEVDVNEQNEGAYAFYSKHRFVKTGRSDTDGSGRPFPLLHLKLQRN
ncbi:acetyltransferase [Paenibacillus phyllosphaerae]|uniref:acetyltransferase n=1 Tax=Paenibacillus phyllosphaerae TaxID=274593 RepID=UPI001FEC3BC1|nr:acetyltransferase [Paenibacillus phyllosphaerae]